MKKYKITITRPAWIQETYEVSSSEGIQMGINPSYAPWTIRKWLEDDSTVQLGTEVSCHMDTSNTVGAEIHEDEFSEITLDEIEEHYEPF